MGIYKHQQEYWDLIITYACMWITDVDGQTAPRAAVVCYNYIKGVHMCVDPS